MDTQHVRVVNSEDKCKELKLVVYGLYNLMVKSMISACITWVILKIRRRKNQQKNKNQKNKTPSVTLSIVIDWSITHLLSLGTSFLPKLEHKGINQEDHRSPKMLRFFKLLIFHRTVSKSPMIFSTNVRTSMGEKAQWPNLPGYFSIS